MLSHIADHVVVDKTFLVLVRIHQTLIAYAVNHPRNTGGDLEHPVNGGVGEDILLAAGIPQMRLYVVSAQQSLSQNHEQLWIPAERGYAASNSMKWMESDPLSLSAK